MRAKESARWSVLLKTANDGAHPMETEAIQQPFENVEFFKLWGLRLDGGWVFNGHMKEAQKI